MPCLSFALLWVYAAGAVGVAALFLSRSRDMRAAVPMALADWRRLGSRGKGARGATGDEQEGEGEGEDEEEESALPFTTAASTDAWSAAAEAEPAGSLQAAVEHVLQRAYYALVRGLRAAAVMGVGCCVRC